MDQEKEKIPVENIGEEQEQNQDAAGQAETVKTKPEEKAAKEKGKKKKEAKNPEKEEFEKLRADYNSLNDQFLRIRAEYDNFRKRSQAEKAQIYNHALADAVAAILPIKDNMDRALAQQQVTVESLQKGLEMIAGQFDSSFKELGVTEIGEKGEAFDPEKHNAVAHIESEDLGENVVAEVLQKGYVLKDDKIVRHAMVQVAN